MRMYEIRNSRVSYNFAEEVDDWVTVSSTINEILLGYLTVVST